MTKVSEIDSINSAIARRILERAEVGHAKYGTTMDRTDLAEVDWLRHLQEELLDAVVYLEKLIQSRSADAQRGAADVLG